MAFSEENGYIPVSVETILAAVMAGINAQFSTTYTVETFLGSNYYKFAYAIAQRMQENEIKTGEIMLKLQQYFLLTNAMISRPVVTNPGLIEKLAAEGYIASLKPMIDADAGKINLCVDVDNADPTYAAQKLEIAGIIRDSTVAGCVTQGGEVTNLVLSNGQSFAFKYHLPTKTATHLKLTITTSENNQTVIGDPDETKALLLDNIEARYRLGKNFEPQRYFSRDDAPWASSVKLEYSLDAGATWLTAIFDADFDDLLTFSIANTTLVEV